VGEGAKTFISYFFLMQVEPVISFRQGRTLSEQGIFVVNVKKKASAVVYSSSKVLFF
jgi:hypothetical protein